MDEPELEQGLKGELETGKEADFFHIEIEEDCLDEKPYYGPIEEAKYNALEFGLTF